MFLVLISVALVLLAVLGRVLLLPVVWVWCALVLLCW